MVACLPRLLPRFVLFEPRVLVQWRRDSGARKELDRARLTEALKDGVTVAGARLVRGQHVRLS